MMTILNIPDSGKTSPDYAPSPDQATTTLAAQSRNSWWTSRRFQPRLWPTLAAVLLVPLFISAGQWQWDKAAGKARLQNVLEARGQEAALSMPTTTIDAESLRYRKIVAHGHFEPQYQVLIDNQMYRAQAGYHVITPLRLEGSEIRVLVNRGWVPASADHSQVPTVITPMGSVDVLGMAVVPSSRFFVLGKDKVQTSSTNSTNSEWQRVWQNLDLGRYGKAVGFPIQPVVLQLDANSMAGGFAREWPRPDDRRQTNLGYALQWWSFAATTVVLWLVLNFRKPA